MNEKGFEINLQKLVMAYVSRWWLFVLAAVVFGAATYGYTYHYVTPLYQASTTIYVNNMVEGTTVNSVSSGQLSASQQLVSTYINIVKSDRVMEKVADALGGGYSAGQVKSMVSASQVGATEIFSVNVTSPNPEETALVANKIAEIVPGELAVLIEGSSARVIDTAKVPTNRISPNYRSRAIKGAIVGAVIAAAYITFLFLMDVRIKDEEDLSLLFDLPVLGQIPEFVTAAKPASYGYGKGGKAAYESRKKPAGTAAAAQKTVTKTAVRRSPEKAEQGKEQEDGKQ